jgi:hypothetical protein
VRWSHSANVATPERPRRRLLSILPRLRLVGLQRRGHPPAPCHHWSHPPQRTAGGDVPPGGLGPHFGALTRIDVVWFSCTYPSPISLQGRVRPHRPKALPPGPLGARLSSDYIPGDQQWPGTLGTTRRWSGFRQHRLCELASAHDGLGLASIRSERSQEACLMLGGKGHGRALAIAARSPARR